MFKLQATTRISLALTMLMLSVLMVSEVLGLLPDRGHDVLAARAAVAKSLAVQISSTAGRNVSLMDHSLRQFVAGHDDVLSAALRVDGALLASHGEHKQNWTSIEGGKSTARQLQVPILHEGQPWGMVEVQFERLWGKSLWDYLNNTYVGMYLFICMGVYCLSYLFLRRALDELNPSKVIPGRVQAAFDTLSEGVMVLDASERIVLANDAIASKLGKPAASLIGQRPARFDWVRDAVQEAAFPWSQAAAQRASATGHTMRLVNPEGGAYVFSVNGGPILDPDGKLRGVITTFDDVSELESMNRELEDSLSALETSREQIENKNKELESLAMRDSLTGCFNRRALFERFAKLIEAASGDEQPLGCIMVDIDHFKQVNDTYGHSVGDDVIRAMAAILRENTRPVDVVCRYGGEEFCLVIPATTKEEVVALAERLRVAISAAAIESGGHSVPITSSLGVAMFAGTGDDAEALINRADEMLYQAKESGRNRVCAWDESAPATRLEAVPHAAHSTRDAAPDSNAASETVEQLRQRVQTLEAQVLQGERQASFSLLHDVTTGLPNRALLLDRLDQSVQRAHRSGAMVAVLSLEVTTLRRVREAMGQSVSEKIRLHIATRLRHVLRGTDTVSLQVLEDEGSMLSYVGSDEFIVLLSEAADRDAVSKVAARIREVLLEPLSEDESPMAEPLYLAGALGISAYPQDSSEADELLQHAASARTQALPGGRLSIAHYAEDNEGALRQLRIEAMLHRALEAREFRLHYQPQFNLHSRAITGVEALLRWTSAELGVVTPLEFIGVAERIGLMPDLTDWVLAQACQQIAQWRALGFPDLRVAVNISAVELADPDMANRVMKILRETNVSPQWLELELTETSVIENLELARKPLETLRNFGIRLTIDDFGTGYSSLGHLAKLPFDGLKLDSCFIRDIDQIAENRAIVEAVVHMARSAAVDVIMEGIETEAELKTLRRLDGVQGQGYIFSRPVPPEEFTQLLMTQQVEAAPSGFDRLRNRFGRG